MNVLMDPGLPYRERFEELIRSKTEAEAPPASEAKKRPRKPRKAKKP